ncbi:hypothetical protein [Methanoregula sp.]|uniref:hypothetical protein n=1 Tax=Methanoregula sp. TaxID=2052170 RepID=UPI0023737910|nr:hypothetical protein [Methanoregula sp.]MDD1685466.1 hypothetical protein [Methanoregula sp.]
MYRIPVRSGAGYGVSTVVHGCEFLAVQTTVHDLFLLVIGILVIAAIRFRRYRSRVTLEEGSLIPVVNRRVRD